MTLISLYKPFRSYHGLVTPRGEPSGNGLRYTGEVLLIDGIPQAFSDSLRAAMLKCESENQPGVFHRSPTRPTQQNSHDDYYAVAFIGKDACRRWLAHGWRNGGCYRNNPNDKSRKTRWQSFLWRFPQLYAHFVLGAGRRPNAFFRLWWALSVALTARRATSKSEDEWILSWFLVRMYDNEFSFVMNLAKAYWQEQLERKVEDGIGGVLWNHYKGKRLTPNAERLEGVFW